MNLADDLALALKAISLRIVAPYQENPSSASKRRTAPEMVSMKEVVTSDAFHAHVPKLSLALGKTIRRRGLRRSEDHAASAGRWRHRGRKSVGLNTMLLSILFSARPDEVKLLLIDPKMLSFKVTTASHTCCAL